MGEQTSIPVDRDARDELAQTKPDGMSWSAYLLALRDESDQLKQLEPSGPGSVEAVADELAEQVAGELATGSVDDAEIERLRDSLAVVEERTGQIQRTLEDLQR